MFRCPKCSQDMDTKKDFDRQVGVFTCPNPDCQYSFCRQASSRKPVLVNTVSVWSVSGVRKTPIPLRDSLLGLW